MNQNRMKATRIAVATLLGTLGAASAIPARAETEVDTLKRELAEQRVLINKLLAAQTTQKKRSKRSRPVRYNLRRKRAAMGAAFPKA